MARRPNALRPGWITTVWLVRCAWKHVDRQIKRAALDGNGRTCVRPCLNLAQRNGDAP